MADIELEARRAGEAARHEAGARPAPPPIGELVVRRRRQRWGAVFAAAAVLCVAVLVQLVPGPQPVIDPVATPGGSQLPLPDPGSALPAELDDGTPVFVSRLDDGEVYVLDATSPHQDIKLVAHCTRNGGFEDVQHGSRFTAERMWLGGPAPDGLAVYPHVRAGSDHVRVTGPATPRPRSDSQRFPQTFDPGPFCFDTETGDHPQDAVYHLPGEPPAAGQLTLERGRWRWTRASFDVVGDTLVMCARAPRGQDALEVPVPHQGWLTGFGRTASDVLVLARLHEDARAEIRLPAHDDGTADLIESTDDTTTKTPALGQGRSWWLGIGLAGAGILALAAAVRRQARR